MVFSFVRVISNHYLGLIIFSFSVWGKFLNSWWYLCNLHNYFNIHVCLSLRRPASVASAASHPTSDFYYVQSSRSPVRPLLSEAKPSCVYSILKPHGQSSKREVRPLLSEAKPSCVYSILKPHGQSFKRPVRLLLCESKLSYVYSILKPPGQTAAERGKAKPGILNFKTTWSEF